MLDFTRRYICGDNGTGVECSACGQRVYCAPSGLTESQLVDFNCLAKARRIVDTGEVIYFASESKSKLYIVCAGSFRSVVNCSDGAEQVTNFYLPGEMMGLDALGGQPAHSTVFANEKSTVCEISEDQFSNLCSQHEALYQYFNRVLREEIVNGQRHMLILGQMKADAKIAAFLVDMSERFEKRGLSAYEYSVNISRHDIANYLGLVPETISRCLHSLHDMGYINVNRRRIIILNMDKIYELSGCAPAVS